MFLWVSLAIKEIINSSNVFTGEDLDVLIRTLLAGLESLYDKAWAKALELLPPERISLARSVLVWLLLAERPLTIGELIVAMAVEPGNQHVPSPQKLIRSLRRFILAYLNPFVEILDTDPSYSLEDQDKGPAGRGYTPPGPKVRLIHQSAQEYLRSVCKAGSKTPGLNIDLQAGHEEIAWICLSYLRCKELQLGWFDLDNRTPSGLQVVTD